MRISDWSADVCSSDRVRVQSYASSVASSDGRNEGVKVWAYYNHGLPGGSIVFDLRGISSENSQMDVFRVLLQFARDRKSVVYGKRVSVRVDLGGRRIIKKKKPQTENKTHITQI